MRKIDIFTHIYPRGFYDKLMQVAGDFKDVGKRSRGVPMLYDLDERFRVMDRFEDYQQILSLPTPPLEVMGSPAQATDLARLANDGMAELVARHPDRFAGFVASLPFNDPEAAVRETRRAVDDLGARGIQIFSNVQGKPVSAPEFLPIFETMAAYDLPIWLHPYRGAAWSDYPTEDASQFEIWWTFGWPYDTSVAMARVVFAGLFDRFPTLKIISHHMGAMAPYFAGRVGPGLGPARRAHVRSGSVAGAEAAQEAPDRLLQDVLRRHGAVRRVRRDRVRPELLRRRPRAVRVGRTVRSREGARGTSARRSTSSIACPSRPRNASASTGATPPRCSNSADTRRSTQRSQSPLRSFSGQSRCDRFLCVLCVLACSALYARGVSSRRCCRGT